MIELNDFVDDLRHVFGANVKLPVAVWRSDKAAGEEVALPHCLFAAIPQIEAGQTVTLSKERLHCGGGRLYCGFAPANPGIANFVSIKERYKQTPDMVEDYISGLGIELTDKQYLNFARIDTLKALTDDVEGVFFLAEPDTLAGLCAWAFYDNNSADAVVCPFASGCCSVISNVINENHRQGHRVFIGMMDLSARPLIGKNELSLAIPMCRLEKMVETLHDCCLWNSNAWGNLKTRMG